MPNPKSQQKFDAAVELGLIGEKEIEEIEQEQRQCNFPALEIAIRKGYLTHGQLEILGVFANPLDVVPGYRIDGFIGRGGTGSVYKATQLRMDRPVAIKTISQAAARNDLTPKRFEREAKIIGQLGHPNIVSAIDFGVHNAQLYLVMEFVDGQDAEQLLADKRRIPEAHAWFIARQVCHALEAAHQHGVIHRDIKPGNLILTSAPQGSVIPINVPFVKVADFGLAKFDDTQRDSTITIEQSVNGTPFYMAPEQIRAEQIDHRCDIYSLGTTVWHLLTGSPPVMGAGPLEVITNKMKLEDEWLSQPEAGMSASSFQLLTRMCRHDRDQRIADYRELDREIGLVIEKLADASTSITESDEFEISEPSFSQSANVKTLGDTPTNLLKSSYTNAGSGHAETAEFKTDSTSSNPIPESTNRTKRLSILIAIPTFAALAIAYFVLSGSKTDPHASSSPRSANNETSTEQQEFERLDEFEGIPILLFDGRRMDPTQRSSGTWEPTTGTEGEFVLAGLGTRDFRCNKKDRSPLREFRFVCGFRHNEADVIGFRMVDGEGNTIWDVNNERDRSTLKHGDNIISFPLQQFDEEKSFGYHQFRFESQPEHWRIELDDALLGEIPKSVTESNDGLTVQLYADGPGPAHFEPMRFRAFKRK